MNTPLVSIIMPNHNGSKYLSESIKSVLTQTFQDYEFIIVDDASTDDSAAIIESFNDERIVFIRNTKNRHVVYTSNTALGYAKGKYIARIDSDDIWEKEKLEKQVNYMEEHPEVGACFTRVHIIDEHAEIADNKFPDLSKLFSDIPNMDHLEWIRHFFYYGNVLCQSSVLIRLETLEKAGKKYRLAFMPGEDYELWTRLLRYQTIYILDEKLTRYRWTTDDGKISKSGTESLYPIRNLQMLLREKYLFGLSNDLFIKAFKEDFINPESLSEEELLCEKANLMLHCSEKNQGKMNCLGFPVFRDILDQEGGLELLEEKYGFDLTEYYKNYKVHNYYDYQAEIDFCNLKSRISQLETALSQMEGIISQNNELIARLEDDYSLEKQRLAECQEELQKIQTEKTKINDELNLTNIDLFNLTQELQGLKSSLIWRGSKPLRDLMDVVSGKGR